MDKQHRLAAFAKRFTAALDRSGLGTASAFGKPRIAESQAAWVTSAGDRAVLDDLALLGAEEREALAVLIRLLRPRGKRPGRRRKLPQS